MKRTLLAICSALMVGSIAAPALANFEVCNTSSNPQTIALAYRDSGEWVSEGWWTIQKEECKTILAGNLKSRYYYFRATVDGGSFKGENYWFCTDPKAFTIQGKSDCESRGYREEEFSEVDTGTASTSYKLTLVDPESMKPAQPETPKADEKATEPSIIKPQANATPQSGSLGEPFSVNAIFQSCESYDGQSSCAFHAEGYKWYAYEGGGTSETLMDQLRQLETGQLIGVGGDLITYGDITTEVAIYGFEKRPSYDEADNTLMGLQGWWRSLDDSKSTMEIAGGEVFDYYDGDGVLEQFIQYTDNCPSAEGLQGPFLLMFAPENYNDPLCYTIEGWDAIILQLGYVGGVGGGLLQFERFYP